MATVEELKAAWDECVAKSKANDAARADIQKQIAGLDAKRVDLENDARTLWRESSAAKLAYDKARLLTVREARFLREAAADGGKLYNPYTGGWRNRMTSPASKMAASLANFGWVWTTIDDFTRVATITKEGRVKLAEYEASKSKPRKKATK